MRGNNFTANLSEKQTQFSVFCEFDFYRDHVHCFLTAQVTSMVNHSGKAMAPNFRIGIGFLTEGNLQSKVALGDLLLFWGKMSLLDLCEGLAVFSSSGFNHWEKPGCFKWEEMVNEACHCL